jgi:hypothetical protein
LQARQAELLQTHRQAWLGELEPLVTPQAVEAENWLRTWRLRRQSGFTFARGWLDEIRLSELTVEQARILARSPTVRLLRRLLVFGTAYYGWAGHPGEPTYEPNSVTPAGLDYPQLRPLIRSRYLGNVRFFHLGEPLRDNGDAESCHTGGDQVDRLVRRMPKLEELHLLAHSMDTSKLFRLETFTNLRVLRVYHAHTYSLERLAANPTLGKLTHLLLHPHAIELGRHHANIGLYGLRAVLRSPHLKNLTHLQVRLTDAGDRGCQEIVQSGSLRRLHWLDLRHGCITDEGARTLAACPDLRRLEHLDVSNNSLTQQGIDALRAVLPAVGADGQHGPGDPENLYLMEGDME